MVMAFLTGCSVIDYDKPREPLRPNSESDSENIQTETNQAGFGDNQSLSFPITRRVFSEKRQMEDLISYENLTALYGFEGEGYIKLEENRSADFVLNVPTPQHYSIGLNLATANYENAVITLSVGGKQQGAFSLRNSESFNEIKLHGIYLEAGANRISLTQVRGSAFIDYITIENFELSDSRFNTSRSPANPKASDSVRLLLDYFGEVFGKKVLLAQHVTPGTNTEIRAIYDATGRFPAIRVSDLMAYARSFPEDGQKPKNDDIELAVEWAENGGIVSYGWTWYSPPINGGDSHYYAGASSLNLNDAFTISKISDLDIGSIESLWEMDAISQSCYELVLEIDYMAENLKRLRDADVPVLWRPMHQASTKWFWWGNCEPEAYKWLWRLMFERFSDFHELDNLIWVWAGQDYDYYPGDSFVDIIAEDIYNMDDVSSAPRFVQAGDYSERKKMTAMTECGLLPSPDLLNRDRALWLWTALYRGDYLVDNRGRVASLYNQKERLNRIYNHELTITLDKLPENF